MKVACLCPTYKRPRELAEAIESFRRQTYPVDQRELIILDDAGQYLPDAADGFPGIKLVTTKHRFRTLGEKRNASAGLCSPDVDAFVVWDDDDIYLPWHVAAAVAGLADADFTIPSKLWLDRKKRLESKANRSLFHGAWAFRREAFERVGGYPWIQSGQDQGLLKRFKAAGLRCADPIQLDPRPSYIYRWHTSHRNHISAMGANGYERLGRLPSDCGQPLKFGWSRDWEAMAYSTRGANAHATTA